MKKILALVLAVALCFSTGVLAFAASDDKEVTNVYFGNGNTSDSFSGVAVPGKNYKIPIELVAAADSTTLVAAVTTATQNKQTADNAESAIQGIMITVLASTEYANVGTAETDLANADANLATAEAAYNDASHDTTDASHIATTCQTCIDYDDAVSAQAAADQALTNAESALDTRVSTASSAVYATYAALEQALSDATDAVTAADTALTNAIDARDNASSTYTVLSQTQAWKAYDTDKAFKLTFKATKGSDYIKSWEVKKTTGGEMYVQVNYNEYYLGGMKDIAYELTLTVTNQTKFNARLSDTAIAAEISFARSEYVKLDTGSLKYGFNGGNVKDPYKDFEIKDGDPTDYDIIANLDSDKGTGSTVTSGGVTSYEYDQNTAIHFKKGTGEIYSFDYGNGNAYFEVKMDGQAVVNLYMSTAAIKALTSAYPDAEMLFWDWKGLPELDFTATVELYYDEDDVGDDPYLYKWDGSVLTEVTSAEFDDETCTFKTRSLGAYVVSDVELDTSVVSSTTTASTEPDEAAEATDAEGGTIGNTQNPGTGASDFVGVAVAMAVVSLAAAGALALKK